MIEEKERGDVTKYYIGMSKIFLLIEDLKAEFLLESNEKELQESLPFLFEDVIFEPLKAPL